MPPGVPVACVGIGKAGARNAALIAVRIMALSDKGLAGKLEDFVKDQAEKILKG
jgi:phosphoribosylcarboxyaminoimidazole (NCAIR) mutase